MRRKILMGVFAIALPFGTIAGFTSGSAFAGKVTGSGTTTCSFGGTISFNPPLTQNGTAGVKKEITTVAATLGSCSGGTPVGNATSVAVKPIKTKTPKGQNGATCSGFTANASTVVVKTKVNWAGEKPSKFNISNLSVIVNPVTGEAGFQGSFPVTGSYAGTGNVTVYLTPQSTNEIASCTSPVSTLNIDPSTSSGAL
jgi:hypothetical protein